MVKEMTMSVLMHVAMSIPTGELLFPPGQDCLSAVHTAARAVGAE